MTAGFLAYLTGAVLMGMSCGTGCSPAITLFLSSYVFHADGDTRRSVAAFLRFFAGKALAVIVVCLTAAAVGSTLLGENGYFGKYRLSLLMPLFLCLTGLYMIRKCAAESAGKGCSGCSGHCCTTTQDHLHSASPFMGGFLYGITPCAPMILLAGYAVTMPLAQALILGTVFSIACMASPLVLMLILMKLVVVRMRSEVPAFYRAMKLVVSFGVLIIGIVSCFTGIEPIV